ncbi:unnamed protein product [Adineta ricciae]|uniref:Nose resistant-to-fluoxetine protein N-terminal domain-containing protein n=1 Tax=Adineta ricciae TaxID=249248 RepID=A0A814M5N5_ADIRI|nr:unnamed protein product [Adineta ricciae]CAF1073575.1 unnamed protein product [Adineta ricciae]
MKSFIKEEKWALKTLDSWGTKLPAGILEGSHLWFGSYDECIYPLYLPANESYVSQPYPTKFCTISSVHINESDNVLFRKPSLLVGICLPESCHSNDFRSQSLDLHCQSEGRQLSIGTLLTLSLIILLTFFVCLAEFIPPLKEYSVLSSLKRIFSLNHQHSTYSCLNGIRALSLFWIIFGHVYIFQLTIIDNPVRVFDNLRNSWVNQLVIGAVYGVDTFFFISGFLSVSVFIHTFNDQNTFHVRYLFLYYFHRYCRLIPTLVFVLLISMYLSPWMGSGPIFPTDNGFEVPACYHSWWATLLFVNNIVSPEKACLPVTWYIANDFQFHLLAPLFLIPFVLNRRRWTYAILVLILLINIITNISLVSTHPGFESGYIATTEVPVDFFEKVYVTPWCRIGAFVIGMMTKLILERCHSTLSSIQVILYTIISIILAIVCIYIPFYSDYVPKFVLILHQSLSRQCWSIAIGWLIFACCNNNARLINKILSWPFWTIIARLSYSAYLIHVTIILVHIYNRVTTIHCQTSVILNNFISLTLLSLFVSIFIVVLVETPCSLFERRIRKYYRERKPLATNHQSYGTIS